MLESIKKNFSSERRVWDEEAAKEQPMIGVEERPKTWWESILYGWQHTLVDTSPFVLPLVVGQALGFSPAQNAAFVSVNLFASAIATLIMTTIGNRLPLVQGTSAVHTGTMASIGGLYGAGAMWGAVVFGAVIQMILGVFGFFGALRKFFPVTVAGVVVVSIGVSLGFLASQWMIGDGSSTNFILAGITLLIIFFLQVACRKIGGGILARASIFISIIIAGLFIGSAFGMVDWTLIQEEPWFRLPTFFPWGAPIEAGTLAWPLVGGAMLGILSGYLAATVESIGDYAAVCTASGEDYKVKHMNRGVFAEGLGTIVAAAFGSMPKTSYTQNVGIIATTKIASRFVVQIAAIFLALYGLIPKFGAIIVAIPDPVIGAVFVVITGSIVVSGLKLVQSGESTPANNLLLGTVLIISITVPAHVEGQEWVEELSPMMQTVLTNEIVLAVLSGVIINLLLNHIFGKKEEKEQEAKS